MQSLLLASDSSLPMGATKVAPTRVDLSSTSFDIAPQSLGSWTELTTYPSPTSYRVSPRHHDGGHTRMEERMEDMFSGGPHYGERMKMGYQKDTTTVYASRLVSPHHKSRTSLHSRHSRYLRFTCIAEQYISTTQLLSIQQCSRTILPYQ